MPFPMQKQQQSMWCWAAVSSSVDCYFTPAAWQKQCEVACGALRRSDCCTTPPNCNTPALLQDGLTVVKHLRGTRRGRIRFDALVQEIDAGYPVCVRIGWYGGGGHFVVVSGYWVSPSGKQYVYVDDPWYLRSQMTYDDLCWNYLSKGAWTGTYFVQQ